jgi:hypothetical protein
MQGCECDNSRSGVGTIPAKLSVKSLLNGHVYTLCEPLRRGRRKRDKGKSEGGDLDVVDHLDASLRCSAVARNRG